MLRDNIAIGVGASERERSHALTLSLSLSLGSGTPREQRRSMLGTFLFTFHETITRQDAMRDDGTECFRGVSYKNDKVYTHKLG